MAPTTTNLDLALGRVVRDRINASTRTWEQAAERSGMSLTTLKRNLNGASFTIPNLDRLAAVLGTTASALLAEAERDAS